jgi:hypothetical protein
LRAVKNGTGIKVLLGAIHYLNDGAPLARQSDTTVFQGFLEAARLRGRIYSLAGRYPMCGSRSHSVHCGRTKQS